MSQKEIGSFLCMNKWTLVFVFFLFSSLPSFAKYSCGWESSNSRPSNFSMKNRLRKISMGLAKVYVDSTTYYSRGADGLIILPPLDWEPFPENIRFRDTVIYNSAYLPVVFDGKILPSNLSFIKKEPVNKKYRLIPYEDTFLPYINNLERIQDLRRNFYLNVNNLPAVRYTASELRSIPKLDDKAAVKRNPLHELIATEEPIEVRPLELPTIAPNYIYWQKFGEHSLQIAQNYISDNWHKGGKSSFFIRNYHKLMVNYKKDKVSFDTTLEWKLNIQQTPADSVHDFNFSEDLIRLENTFSIQAFRNWSYSAKLETKTQFFDSYPINEEKKNTAFMSPFTMNLGLGLKYSLEKKYESDIAKKFVFTQNISPLSLNYIYLKDRSIAKRPGGLEDGERSKMEVGSLINTDLTFNFNRYMTWTSRLKYFTNYERAEFEFENKFDMALNRFLSTSLYVYMRFDDNVPKDNKLGFFQFNELLSFGLNYKW